MPLFGPPDLQKLEEKKDVKGLIKALDYQNQKQAHIAIGIRFGACQALGRLRDAAAVEPLIGVIQRGKDEREHVREAAILALAQIRDRRGGDVVSSMLNDNSLTIIRAAAKAYVLLCLTDSSVTAAALFHPVIPVREETIAMLGRLGMMQTLAGGHSQPPEGYANAVKAGDVLLGAVCESTPHTRSLIIKAMETCEFTQSAENLAWYAIAKKDWQGCLRMGSAAVPALIRALHSERDRREAYTKNLDAEVKWQERFTSGGYAQTTRIREWYAELEEVDLAVIQLLGDIGDERAIQPLIEALWSRKGEKIQESIAKFGERAFPALLSELTNPDKWELHATLASILEKAGWKPDAGRQGAFYHAARQDWKMCQQCGAEALDAMTLWLSHPMAPMDTIAIYEALGAIGDPRAVPLLLPGLTERRQEWRKAAAETLLKLYAGDKLDDAGKSLVLAQRDAIQQGHADKHHDHNDTIGPDECDLGWEHTDSHADTGIGIEFPL